MLVGIDEVGRGSWAGPVVAGAVILPRDIPGLKDSKKLTKRERGRLAVLIQRRALAVGLGWVTAPVIDEIGLGTAVRLAMERALLQITVAYDEVIIDGHYNFLPEYPGTRAVIRADDSVAAVSAASIVAKVARDAYMTDIAITYPEYGFERHVGYGTALHHAALRQHGVTPQHRRSYKPIKSLCGIKTRGLEHSVGQ